MEDLPGTFPLSLRSSLLAPAFLSALRRPARLVWWTLAVALDSRASDAGCERPSISICLMKSAALSMSLAEAFATASRSGLESPESRSMLLAIVLVVLRNSDSYSANITAKYAADTPTRASNQRARALAKEPTQVCQGCSFSTPPHIHTHTPCFPLPKQPAPDAARDPIVHYISTHIHSSQVSPGPRSAGACTVINPRIFPSSVRHGVRHTPSDEGGAREFSYS